ncbi:MAG TPA: hypothetical protein VK513_15335 [Terriglobales bacterium]|nr:hypothetical protein [Terriglobales bacterium]
MHEHRTRAVLTALLAVAVAALGLAGGASAKLVGNYTRFAQCPYKNPEVARCLYSTTNSGEVVLGKKTVPIEKAVVLQGGYAESDAKGNSKFIGATNGITLSKAAQNVPGGLLGIVPEASQPPLVKALIKFFFENKLTGLTSTLELAKSASDIVVNEEALGGELGPGLTLPVKVHLENPFLGKSCFVGSSSSPITWELTSGTTSPPGPNKPITGTLGEIQFLEGGSILETKGTKIVDNAWSAPGASGCGGILAFLVNPIINSQLGTTTKGNNTAILNNTIFIAAAPAVKSNDEENP